MPILDAHHDLAHPVEADPAWSESYYFNAYDPASDSGLFTRIGIRPNEGTMDVGLSLWLPGGRLGEYRAVRPQSEMVDRTLDVGAVRYQLLEPLARWRLTLAGPVEVRDCSPGSEPSGTADIALDVTFEATSPAVGTDGQGSGPRSSEARAASRSVGRGHLEQAGRWAGTLAVDGTVSRWAEARGNRDRSWGPRHWGGPRMWRWFSVNVGDDVAFGGIRLGTDAGDLHRGWVWAGGRATSIAEWSVRTETEADGLTQRRCEVVATDKAGRAHRLTGHVRRVASVGRVGTGTVVNEGLTRWEYEGRTGYGIAEYLHQLDADGRPVVPVE